MATCACGKRMNKWSERCRSCHEADMAALHGKAQRIVATGKCPDCGAGLRRNVALSGWWQCEQYGAESYRARPQGPQCSFQTFTE